MKVIDRLKFFTLISITISIFPLHAEDKFSFEKYRFLTECTWTGISTHNRKEHRFEIIPFMRKEGSRLFKIKRERVNYYLEEIHGGFLYIPDVPGYKGDKILEISDEIYRWEHIIKLADGREMITYPSMYRVFNSNYKKDADPLYGDWTLKSSPYDYHEYKTVSGDYNFLIFIPDYDTASKYNENGWHYLGYNRENEFETDKSFPDASFRLLIKNEKQLVLVPLFKKHDNSDGIIYLQPGKP